MTACLIDGRPILVTAELVAALDGKPADAIVVQQIHFWSQHSNNRHDGHVWVYNTYAQWAEQTGLSADQVRRATDRLVDRGVIIVAQPQGRDRTRWYRVNYEHPIASPTGSAATPSGKDATSLQQADLPDDSIATEMSREDNREVSLPTAVDVDPDVGFEEAWGRYPKRNGKRVGKKTASDKWRKLTVEGRRECWKAIGNYAAAVNRGETIAKDMERFLAANYWRDWTEPPDPSMNGVQSGQRRATVSDWAGKTGGKLTRT